MCMKKFIKRFNSLLPGLVAHDIHERHVMNLALEKKHSERFQLLALNFALPHIRESSVGI